MYFLIEFLSAFRSLFKAAHLKLCGLLITYVHRLSRRSVCKLYTFKMYHTHKREKNQVSKNDQIAVRWRYYILMLNKVIFENRLHL